MDVTLRIILVVLITVNTALAVYGYVRERNRYNRLRDVCLMLLDYRRRNTTNFQLEKMDDYLIEIQRMIIEGW